MGVRPRCKIFTSLVFSICPIVDLHNENVNTGDETIVASRKDCLQLNKLLPRIERIPSQQCCKRLGLERAVLGGAAQQNTHLRLKVVHGLRCGVYHVVQHVHLRLNILHPALHQVSLVQDVQDKLVLHGDDVLKLREFHLAPYDRGRVLRDFVLRVLELLRFFDDFLV